MAATRERLEAVIREQLTRAVANALTSGVPSTGMMNRATETILAEVDEYAGAEVGLLTPAERRRVIEAAGS
jgi:hypothetical protein